MNSNQKFRKTIKGVVSDSFHHQLEHSLKRGHPPPEYTKKELYEWFILQPNHKKLFDDWVESGYQRLKKPSVNRLDDNLGYSFVNIELITFEDNCNKSYDKMKEGIIIHGVNPQKSVARIDDLGNETPYHSIRQASRENKVHSQNIYKVCTGKRASAGGFKWKYL